MDAEESADPPEPPSPGSERSELSGKDILAIETTARAFIRELDAVRQSLRAARARSEQEFHAERKKSARRLVQVMTSCPPPLSFSASPTHTPGSAPDTPPDGGRYGSCGGSGTAEQEAEQEEAMKEVIKRPAANVLNVGWIDGWMSYMRPSIKAIFGANPFFVSQNLGFKQARLGKHNCNM